MVSVLKQHHGRPVRILGNVCTNTQIDLFLLPGLTKDKFLWCFMLGANTWYQIQRLGIQSVMIRLTLGNPEIAFKYDCCCRASQRSTQLSCAKELSQIMSGWCVWVDSSLCLDKRSTKSFQLQAASRLLSLFSSLPLKWKRLYFCGIAAHLSFPQ